MRGIGYKSKKFNTFIFKMLVIVVTSSFIFGFINIRSIADESNLPDIKISSVDYDSMLYENEDTEFIIIIKNIGDKNLSGEEIKIALFLDDSSIPVSYNSTSGVIDIGESIYLNISWTPNFGDDKNHVLRVVVNYEELFNEKNFDNNIVDFHAIIKEKETSLEIIDVSIPDYIKVNETSIFNVRIINNGETTNKNITAKMNTVTDGEIDIFEISGLDRDESYNFEFTWIPSKAVIEKITFYVYLGNKLHDTFSKNVAVSGKDFEWWDENWHYRYILSLDGEGNFSKFLNFSEIFDDFGISEYVFENEKIRIVKYSDNGEIVNVVNEYSFVESNNFDSSDNATGYLKWKVSNESDIKHYLIYFDVEENRGFRSKITESFIGEESDDIEIQSETYYESWWAEIASPTDKSLVLLGENINISIISVAKIDYVSCYIYNNLDKDNYNYLVDLKDASDGTIWYNDTISCCKEGNWSINVSCMDDAGVYYNFSDIFYVGQPDLKISDILFSVNDKSYTTLHNDDNLNITAVVESSFVSLEDVDFLLEIFDTENKKIIFSDTKTFDLYKDQITNVYFNWLANVSGEFDITIYLDFNNDTYEKNELNNNLTKKIIIYDWPDLFVKDISLPTFEITEFDEVKIEVEIANQGFGDAYDYKIGLFIEKISGNDPTMVYESLIDSKLIDLKSNSSKIFDLYWDSAKPGDWFVGIEVFYNESNYDTNRWNNKLLCLDSLFVRAIESKKPIIRDVTVSPIVPYQGDNIIIRANIYDDTGLEKVDINITDPKNTVHQGKMIRTLGDQFKYDFDSTYEVGEYIFSIKAVDNTIKNSIQTVQGNFEINKDDVKPEILYFNADPIVQLLNDTVEIGCIVSDNVGISNVEITIFPPDELLYKSNMNLDKDGKYFYTDIYSNVGKYDYTIEIEDVSDNVERSSKKHFWITKDLKDFDNDGMPNSWEEKYNLDLYDDSDAEEDNDGDGYTNLEEYEMNTNPEKEILLQNIAYEIKENFWYLIISTVIFFTLVITSFYTKRRIFG